MKRGDSFITHIIGTVDSVVEQTRGRTVAIVKNSKRSYEVVVNGEGELVSVRSYPVAIGRDQDGGDSSLSCYHGNLAKQAVGDGKP